MAHRSLLNPVKSELEDGIYQTMVMSALGTGFIVQEFHAIDPRSIVDIMIHEITKEEVEYGYTKNVKSIKKKAGGLVIRGKEVITTHNDEGWIRCVYAIGKKDAGIMIVTMIEKENYDTEGYILSDFWKSLKLAIR